MESMYTRTKAEVEAASRLRPHPEASLPIAVMRDLMKPTTLLYMAEYRGMLTAFQTRGDEQRRPVR